VSDNATIDAAIAEERFARILEFARFDTRALLREIDARRAARSPEERRMAAVAAARNRRLAARALIGERAPEWLEELVAKRGPDIFEKGDGPVLRVATRVAFGEERADAIATLTRHLLDRNVGHFVTLALIGTWATYYAGPVPHEGEILEIVARVVEERNRARRHA
jgi:hypothetical protein